MFTNQLLGKLREMIKSKPTVHRQVKSRQRAALSLEFLEARDVPSITPLSNELMTNTNRVNNQSNADVAMSALGRTITVWQNDSPAGAGGGIWARLQDASGNTVAVDVDGGDFLVEADTLGTLVKGGQYVGGNANRLPRVGMNADGKFVIVWQTSNASALADNDIRGKVFDVNGTLLGSRFNVTSTAASSETTPAVAMDSTGNFVAAWQVSTNIKAQRYAVDAWGQVTGTNPSGSAFQVNQNILPVPVGGIVSSYDPDVAMDNGRMVFSWTNSFGDSQPNYPVLVIARSMSFSSGGGSNEFFVNQIYTPYPQPIFHYPMQQVSTAVAISNDGLSYVVTYNQVSLGVYMDTDPMRMNVWAKMFSIDPATLNSTATTSAFYVNTTLAGDQLNADVAMDAVGNFVVSWQSRSSGGGVPAQDGDGSGIFARTFGYNSTTYAVSGGSEFQVNQTYVNEQSMPAIAMSDSGLLAIAWQSFDPTDLNMDGISDYKLDIYNRRYSVTF